LAGRYVGSQAGCAMLTQLAPGQHGGASQGARCRRCPMSPLVVEVSEESRVLRWEVDD